LPLPLLPLISQEQRDRLALSKPEGMIALAASAPRHTACLKQGGKKQEGRMPWGIGWQGLKKLADKKSTSLEDQITNKQKIDYISRTFCTDSKSFVEDHPEYKEIMEVFKKDTTTEEISNNLDEIDSKKSFVFSGLIENYEKLDFMGKIALGLLLLKYVLISSLISIVFIFYGDYLIEKYQLEVKYPKLAKIIKLRREFKKYYLIIDSLIIISVILIEIIFCIGILFF
jgi:hypothetical protein